MQKSNLLSRFAVRHARLVALIGIGLAAVGAYYSALLYINLRTDIEELLPTQARSGRDLKTLTERLDSFDYIAVLMFSKNAEAGRRYQDALAKQFQTIPKRLAASVEYRIADEVHFFKSRLGLYLDLPDLTRVKTYVHDRIRFEREMYSPFNIFPVTDRMKKPTLDFDSLKKKYQQGGSYENYPDGYYATPDGTVRVILVYLKGKQSDIHNAEQLKAEIDRRVAESHPETYAPDMRIAYTGGIEGNLEEHAALIADLELSTLVVIVLVSLAMILFYRDVTATLALIASLFVGTLWTFGIAYFVIGYLNANSAFLGSIVIGNGINFGIILLARYVEERRRGRAAEESVHIGVTETLSPTLTAALAAGLSYGSLMLTRFRGFRQFGIIGFIGMVLCWISAYTVLPALLTLFDRKRTVPTLAERELEERGGLVSGAIARLIEKHWRAVCATSLVLSCLAAAMLPRLNHNIIETDLSRLRSKWSLEHGAGFYDHYLKDVFQRYLTRTVILTRDRNEAVQVEDALKKIKARDEAEHQPVIGTVQTINDFVPTEQEKKIPLLEEMRKELTPQVVANLPKDEKSWVTDFLRPEEFKTFTEKDLPPMIIDKFTEINGSVGNFVVVAPPLEQNDDIAWNGTRLIHYIRDLREGADSVRPGIPVSGQHPISADLVESISQDGPRATSFALLAVMGLVIVLFRDWETIGLALLALFQGVLWLAGLILGFRLKINFLNFIALPITFGIGVDYGVNIFQRYRVEKQRDPSSRRILTVIRHTGGAVMLASLTTIIGYSSLLIASSLAFVSFGRLAVLGELTCITAAVVSLPAYLLLRDRRAEKKAGVSPSSLSTTRTGERRPDGAHHGGQTEIESPLT